jgi:hypothetical protein
MEISFISYYCLWQHFWGLLSEAVHVSGQVSKRSKWCRCRLKIDIAARYEILSIHDDDVKEQENI